MSRQREDFFDRIRTCCPKDILTYAEKHPPKGRASRICDFFILAHRLDPEWYRKPAVITNACRQFLINRRAALSETTGKPVKEVTVISDYIAVHYYLNKLQKAKSQTWRPCIVVRTPSRTGKPSRNQAKDHE